MEHQVTNMGEHIPMTPKPGAVVFAKDLQRVAKFYEEVVLLTVTHSERDHVVLESAAIQLVVHAIPQQIAKSISITEPPTVREETPIKLFFPVPSLAEARARASALGGQLNPSQKEWEARGFRACDGYDPEGNVVQLRQNVP
jgi:predicted enzyme related to lactoylglutathione lyase